MHLQSPPFWWLMTIRLSLQQGSKIWSVHTPLTNLKSRFRETPPEDVHILRILLFTANAHWWFISWRSPPESCKSCIHITYSMKKVKMHDDKCYVTNFSMCALKTWGVSTRRKTFKSVRVPSGLSYNSLHKNFRRDKSLWLKYSS